MGFHLSLAGRQNHGVRGISNNTSDLSVEFRWLLLVASGGLLSPSALKLAQSAPPKLLPAGQTTKPHPISFLYFVSSLKKKKWFSRLPDRQEGSCSALLGAAQSHSFCTEVSTEDFLCLGTLRFAWPNVLSLLYLICVNLQVYEYNQKGEGGDSPKCASLLLAKRSAPLHN